MFNITTESIYIILGKLDKCTEVAYISFHYTYVRF